MFFPCYFQKHYEKYDGFVILHGTDTMAYTASALSFMCEHLGKPVILTGSQVYTWSYTHTHTILCFSQHFPRKYLLFPVQGRTIFVIEFDDKRVFYSYSLVHSNML